MYTRVQKHVEPNWNNKLIYIVHLLEGPRRRGRLRNGWREEVEIDLQVLGVRRWRELVRDRDKWRGIVRQAKAHSGLQRKRKKKKNIVHLHLLVPT